MMRRPNWLMVVVTFSLALLPLLAWWQYRWLGAVSEAERQRMSGNLQTAASQFAEAFDQELTSVFHFLHPGDWPANGAQPERAFSSQYRQWLSFTKHPGLVKDVYEVEFDAADKLRLSRFDVQTFAFAPAAWDASLTALQACVKSARETAKEFARSPLTRKLPPLPEGKTIIQLSLNNTFDDALPGMVWPLDTSPDQLSPASRYRVAVFDLAYLQQTLLPALAQRHLLATPDATYAIAVFKRGDREHPLYQQGMSHKAEWQTVDVTQSFGKVNWQDPRPMVSPDAEAKSSVPSVRQREPARELQVRRVENRMVELNSQQMATQSTSRVIVTSNQDATKLASSGNALPMELLPNMLQNKADGPWQLLVKHRAGSLEAAVTQARRRNLAISFGVLALLGLSVGLLLLASRRSQSLAARQMEFVAGVSHELRTPLAVICSAAENLADGVVSNPAQMQQYGALIRDEGRRLNGMVEQVLEFAGAQSGKRAYELKPVNPRTIIDDALKALKVPLTEQGFYVEEDWPPRLPMIQADAAALSRALQNLLTNAMKYSDASRCITLRAAVVNQNEIQFTAEDRGIGIPADELPHLGEAFYRGKAAVAAQIHGNGLGLSIVRQIAQAHGGRLSFTSEVGRGSKFTLHLPLSRETQTQLAAEELNKHVEAL